jgi:hypothetical protein
VVEVQLVGGDGPRALRQLGSLTQRYGMRIEAIVAAMVREPIARANIWVPRAADKPEAEAMVLLLLDWIRKAGGCSQELEWRVRAR